MTARISSEFVSPIIFNVGAVVEDIEADVAANFSLWLIISIFVLRTMVSTIVLSQKRFQASISDVTNFAASLQPGIF